MTLEPFVGKPVAGEPPLWPPWAYLTLAAMTVGMVLALAVLARQAVHIGEDRETARVLILTADRIARLEGQVDSLKAYADELRARSEANRRRIEAVEGEGGTGPIVVPFADQDRGD